MRIRSRALTALALSGALSLMLAPAPGASAEPVVSKLRVEAGGEALDPGTAYASDSLEKRTSSAGQCGGSGDTYTLQGPTAMGILGYASQPNDRLSPVRISDRFSFSLVVCGLGDFLGFADSFWFYKVNHTAPDVGADKYPLEGGEEVLWYFVEPSTARNTGDELALRAPARAMPGEPFEVTAHLYSPSGERTPAAGVRILRAGGATTNAEGKATVTLDEEGIARLRAVRGRHIPSAPTAVCVNSDLDRCPSRRGERIFGTTGPERIAGTRGPDQIFARGGADRIFVVGGGRDRVDCGPDRDRVRADAQDVVAGNCEVVTVAEE